jgi:hypothetical protein
VSEEAKPKLTVPSGSALLGWIAPGNYRAGAVLPSFFVENLVRRGWPNASGAALKKHDAEPFLQLGNLLAEGWLRDMDDGGRAGKAAGIDNFHKISKLRNCI